MSRDEVAISVQGVSKSFKLPHERQGSVKNAFINVFRGARTFEKQEVLRDISFEIKKGEFFGIVGRNGSGKSTLLKLLAGIYSPDKGHIQVNGKLTPFIELGVGFNPELTGRENVFLNGALLGFSRQEMEAMYQEIVDFAEIENFMDQKLKNYSSGMQVRLAFSIAIRAESEILVLDEVLAVGDAAFQKKCLQVFESYKESKRTIILVTHEMDVVKKFCSKALLINEGIIDVIGDPDKVANEYKKINEYSVIAAAKEDNIKRSASYKTKITSKSLKNTTKISSGKDIVFEIDYAWAAKEVRGIGVVIHKTTGEYVFGANTFLDKVDIRRNTTKTFYKIQAKLGKGEYFVKAAIFGSNDQDIIEYVDQGPKFEIIAKEQAWEGITNLKHEWI